MNKFNDPLIDNLAQKFRPIKPNTRKRDIFEDLIDSITSQQLSIKAAATIYGRVKDRCGTLNPQSVLKVSDQDLRDCGLSWNKVSFVKDLANKILDGTIQLDKLVDMTDQEIIDHLVKVKGIGRWTAEMLLIFTFERPDVFPVDDLGIQKAMCKLYNLRPTKTLKVRMQKIAKNWIPNRTLACRYLWKSLDNA
ncbi:MAG: DNA-3-methyladenine glycosylase 2 family protein [Patescibacteria group bacterium]